MRLFISSSIPLLVVLLSLLSISTTIIAAPKTSPPSPPSKPQAQPAESIADDKCRPCLARELRKVPKCDRLSPTTPALPASEDNPAKIQKYKNDYPDVVDCLCLAAKWTDDEGGSQDWISRCDTVCTAAVSKNQMKILKAFAAQLSCGGSDDSAAASPSRPPDITDTIRAPPVRKPANAAGEIPSSLAAGTTAAPSSDALKPREVVATKPDPKPAAVVREPVAAGNTSSTTPDMKDNKTRGDENPAL
ncbi:hypothetical protein BG015_005995 [Linnemannia schmuckeri]|uniref:Uncharacterized protein n=1 Tax=Linnemannia schmuckeri TaxID=64567 RepID=A0A9P5S2J1_9FUNG|nr:hypothetical protein BG015_005995 [Linnemannia schmuckeri]